MPVQTDDKPKPKVQSKTIWGIATTLVGLLLAAVGLGPDDVAFLADGLQAEDIPAIAAILGTLFTAYGIRAAHRPLE